MVSVKEYSNKLDFEKLSTTFHHQQDQLFLEHTEHSDREETCCFVIYGLFSPRLSVNIHLACLSCTSSAA